MQRYKVLRTFKYGKKGEEGQHDRHVVSAWVTRGLVERLPDTPPKKAVKKPATKRSTKKPATKTK